MRIIQISLFWLICFSGFSQSSSQLVIKDEVHYVFGQIFTDFRYSFNEYNPKAAFNFNQGLLGYKHQLAGNVTGTIMLDVTRTTHFFEITDTAGNQLDYKYFEGSKFTAFLKMAEIKWDINDFLTLRVGQLLSTQYLTFQDRFWGYRYIDVTYQERWRLGMPADFGAQMDFKIGDKIINQVSVVNGEGPFRYQDDNGGFIFANNIQYNPTENITLKLYVDYGTAPDTGINIKDKSVISGFAGYKTKKFRIGGEYTYVTNYGYDDGTDYYGYSLYGSVVLSPKFQALARYDHLDLVLPEEGKNLDYYILGFQYEPVTHFTTSLNYRYYNVNNLSFIYASFGLKF
jgi:hypothetical protein